MIFPLKKNSYLSLLPFVIFFLLSIIICPMIGSVDINILEAIKNIGSNSTSIDASILFVTRMPRIFLAAVTGAALSLAGATFQALLRNPLATPYTLGVSSGGSLGAVLAIKLAFDISLFGLSSIALMSFLGAVITVGIVFMLSRSKGQLPTPILLLAGVSLSFFFSAMILFVHYVSDFAESYKMMRWLMGGLNVIEYGDTLSILPFWLIATVILLSRSRDLDQLTLGHYIAWSRGVNVSRTLKLSYFAASMLTASVVSLAGPIGFVGLIVPHTIRFLIGPSYPKLMLACLFAGAGFLVVCDTVARVIIAPTEIPVGILTALIGGPFFIILLYKEKGKLSYEE